MDICFCTRECLRYRCIKLYIGFFSIQKCTICVFDTRMAPGRKATLEVCKLESVPKFGSKKTILCKPCLPLLKYYGEFIPLRINFINLETKLF